LLQEIESDDSITSYQLAGQERDAELHETWLGNETVTDVSLPLHCSLMLVSSQLPSTLDSSEHTERLNHSVDLEKERQLMQCIASNVDYLCVMSLEILTLPDSGRVIAEPALDQVLGVFFTVDEDVCKPSRNEKRLHKIGIVISDLVDVFPLKYTVSVNSEPELYEELEKSVRRYDHVYNDLLP